MHKQHTYALKVCKYVLRHAKVVELGLDVTYNIVDNSAIDGGLNKGSTVIKGSLKSTS